MVSHYLIACQNPDHTKPLCTYIQLSSNIFLSFLFSFPLSSTYLMIWFACIFCFSMIEHGCWLIIWFWYIWLITFSFKPWSFQIKLKKGLLKRRWEEGRLKSNGSRTPQIGKSPSANAATVCWRKLMNCQFFVMLKLPLLSSQAVAVCMSMPTTGYIYIYIPRTNLS